MSFFDKLRDRTRDIFRKQPSHYGGDGRMSSNLNNTAHRIVCKTEKAVHRGTNEVCKATHSGINKANKTTHQIEKESKSFWKKVTKR